MSLEQRPGRMLAMACPGLLPQVRSRQSLTLRLAGPRVWTHADDEDVGQDHRAQVFLGNWAVDASQ